MNDDLINSIPSLEVLENRFKFVKNQILKTNSAIYLQYIILLLAISEEKNLGNLRYSVYKDVIIHTASIVESILEYAVNEYIVQGKASQAIFGYSWHYAELARVQHDCSDFTDASLAVVKKERGFKSKSRDLGFDDINRAAKTAEIIDDRLHKKAENLRKCRNYIHLSSLEKSSNDLLDKADVKKCLDDTKAILLEVEIKLNKLYDV